MPFCMKQKNFKTEIKLLLEKAFSGTCLIETENCDKILPVRIVLFFSKQKFNIQNFNKNRAEVLFLKRILKTL